MSKVGRFYHFRFMELDAALVTFGEEAGIYSGMYGTDLRRSSCPLESKQDSSTVSAVPDIILLPTRKI
jgi:hypothetical protein